MSTTARAGRKTGPKPKFTSDDAVDAALSLGIDRFTLGGVAKQLGVATSAVYRLFNNRDALVDACLARAARDLTRAPIPSDNWQDALRSWAEQTWNVCEKYPGLDLVIYQFAGSFTHLDDYFTTLVSTLTSCGLGRETAMFAIDFIGDTVVSTHIGVAAFRRIDDDGHSGLERAASRASSDTIFIPEQRWVERGYLEEKIEFILRGLAREI